MPLDKQGNISPYPSVRESRDLTLNDGRDFFRPELRVLTGQALLNVGDQLCLVCPSHEDSVRPQTATVNRYLRSSAPLRAVPPEGPVKG